MDGPETLATGELDPPTVSDPVDVLLAVDGEDAFRPPPLGYEAVEAVECSDVENRGPDERSGDRRKPVAVSRALPGVYTPWSRLRANVWNHSGTDVSTRVA